MLGLVFLLGPLAMTGGGQGDSVFLMKELLFRSGVVVVAISALARWARQSGEAPRLPLCGWVLLGLGLWSLLSLAWSHTAYFWLDQLPKYASALVLFILVAGRFVSREVWRYAMIAAMVAATINALTMLAQYYLGVTGIPQGIAPGGFFGNRNTAAQFNGAVLPLVVAFGVIQTRVVWRSVLTALALLLGFTLVIVAARSVLLGLMVGLVFAMLLDNTWKRVPGWWRAAKLRPYAYGVPTFAGLLIVALVLADADGPLRQKIDDLELAYTRVRSENTESGGSAAINYRLLMLNNSRAIMEDHRLIGTGAGTWAAVYHGYAQANQVDTVFSSAKTLFHAHNFYLEKTVELGLVGAGLLLAALLTFVGQAWRRIRAQDRGSPDSWFPIGAVVSALVLMVSAGFSMPLNYATGPFVLALVAGVALREPDRSAASAASGSPLAPPMVRWIVVGGAGVLALANLADARHDWTVHQRFVEADQWHGQGDNERYANALRRVLALDAQHYRANTRMASLLRLTDPDASRRHLERVAAIYPNIPSNLGQYALLETSLGDLDQAKEWLERLLDIAPSDEVALREMVGNAYARGELEAALGYAKRLAAVDPENERYQLTRQNLARLVRQANAEAESPAGQP